jgi:hypothetical protein
MNKIIDEQWWEGLKAEARREREQNERSPSSEELAQVETEFTSVCESLSSSEREPLPSQEVERLIRYARTRAELFDNKALMAPERRAAAAGAEDPIVDHGSVVRSIFELEMLDSDTRLVADADGRLTVFPPPAPSFTHIKIGPDLFPLQACGDATVIVGLGRAALEAYLKERMGRGSPPEIRLVKSGGPEHEAMDS